MGNSKTFNSPKASAAHTSSQAGHSARVTARKPALHQAQLRAGADGRRQPQGRTVNARDGDPTQSMAHRNRIVGVRKNADGDMVQFKFADGRVVDYTDAIAFAKDGQVEHANAFRG